MPKGNGQVELCSCGVHYPIGGAAFCAANRHGVKEAAFPDAHRHVNSLELSVEAFCHECGARLSAEFKVERDGRLVLQILPHLCPVEEPAESTQEVHVHEHSRAA